LASWVACFAQVASQGKPSNPFGICGSRREGAAEPKNQSLNFYLIILGYYILYKERLNAFGMFHFSAELKPIGFKLFFLSKV
jgi:hypothetical protein